MRPVHRLLFYAGVLGAVASGKGCAGGCGGCPGQGGSYTFPQSRVQERIFKARLNRAGIDFLRPRLKDLLKALLGTDALGRIRLPVGPQHVTGLGNQGDFLNTQIYLQDDPNTSAAGDAGWVAIDFSSLDVDLVPGPPPAIQISVRNALVDLDLRLLATWEACVLGACTGGSAACYVRGAVDRGTPSQRALLLDLDVQATLEVDASGNFRPTVTIPTLRTHDLDTSIDPAPRSDPECADGLYSGECQDFCGAADVVEDLLVAVRDFLGGFLDTALRALLPPLIENQMSGRPLKFQGQMALADLFGGSLPSLRQARPLGYLLQPGPDGFRVDGSGPSQGLNLAMNGGLESSPAHPCSPALDPLPLFVPGDFPALAGRDSQGRIYHLALTLSDAFLNQGGVAAYTSGALCLSVSTADLARLTGGRFNITAGALALLVPGLREIAGNDAPILIQLVPTAPPSFRFGSGELVGTERDSLIRMKIPGLTFSFYALVHDRYTRLFQFRSDVEVGLTVVVLPDDRLQITVDRVTIDKLTQLYNEIFADSDLQAALRLLVDLATTALFGQGIELEIDVTDSLPAPLRGQIGLRVNEVVRDGPGRDFLTVSLTLLDLTRPRPLRFAARTRAALSPSYPPMEVDLQGRRLATGRIALDVGGAGRHGDDRDLEYQVRLDAGPWSAFAPGPRIHLDSPRLLLVGDHEVEVRARVRGEPRTLDPTPAVVSFVVDPLPPRLWLSPGPDAVRLDADDERTPRERITFSWRVDDGAWSEYRPAEAIAFASLPPGRRLEVRARDEAGNVSPPATLRLHVHGRPGEADPGCPQGCAAGPAGTGLWLAALPFLCALLARRRRALLAALALAPAILAGCGDTARACGTNADCPQGFRCLEKVCQPQGRCDDPENPTPCCPGQFCSVAGTCLDVINRCNADSSCDTPGQVCNGMGEAGFCSFAPCARDADCRGASCFNGFCRQPMPCGGGCADDEVCVTPTDECYPAPAQCLSVHCPPGQMRVFDAVATLVGATCDLAAATCLCADLPEVPGGDWGRESRIAVLAGGRPVVSAYDKTYGDLVLARYDAQGVLETVEHVDGVPAGVPPVGRVSGRRGGIAEPGPNTGRHTSVAVDAAGNPIIAYYDVDNADLKLAAWDGTRWLTHTVDAPGDVGRYAHLVVGPGGIPTIAYFQMNGGTGNPMRGVKVARARVQHPRDAADWEVSAVELAAPPPPPPPPCGGCPGGEVCVRGAGAGGADGCVAPDSPPRCSPACAATQACVGGACRDRVPDPPPPLDDLPEGVGLFPSLAFSPSGIPHLAYYDRIGGNLKGARASSASPAGPSDWQVFVVDGAPGTFVDGDVGLFPSLAFAPDGKIAIAFEDATNDDLVFYLGSDFTGGRREIIDSGVSGAPLSLVGADASLAFAPDGRAFVAYQDATLNDLKLAWRTGPGTWEQSTVLGDGAWGFFADLVISGGRLYISNLKFAFDENALPLNEVRVVIQNLP
jgi:hypothetical protein